MQIGHTFSLITASQQVSDIHTENELVSIHWDIVLYTSIHTQDHSVNGQQAGRIFIFTPCCSCSKSQMVNGGVLKARL